MADNQYEQINKDFLLDLIKTSSPAILDVLAEDFGYGDDAHSQIDSLIANIERDEYVAYQTPEAPYTLRKHGGKLASGWGAPFMQQPYFGLSAPGEGRMPPQLYTKEESKKLAKELFLRPGVTDTAFIASKNYNLEPIWGKDVPEEEKLLSLVHELLHPFMLHYLREDEETGLDMFNEGAMKIAGKYKESKGDNYNQILKENLGAKSLWDKLIGD